MSLYFKKLGAVRYKHNIHPLSGIQLCTTSVIDISKMWKIKMQTLCTARVK